MIPCWIFTGFAKCQRIVSVNDFWLPRRLQELLHAPLRFLRSFCFTRIRLDPLGSQVLLHDCISVIVPGITSPIEDFVIRCYQVTKPCCSWNRSLIASSFPRNFRSFAYVAISVSREVSINTVLQFLCLHF